MQLQHNSKLKKHLTKALAFTLAMLMFIGAPLTTHATGVGDSGDNTGGGEGGMSGSTSDLAWSQRHQGYRIYIIDQDFVRISNVYDFTYSEPYAGNWEYSTRFDGANSPTTPYYYDISTLQSWCDSSDAVPTPTKLSNGTRVGNGYEFKQWFFAGQAGTSIDTGGGNGSGSGSGSGSGTGTGGIDSGDPSRGDNDTRADRAAANQLYNQAKSADLVYGNRISVHTNYTGSGGIENYFNGYNGEYECTYNDLKSFINTNVSFIINNADGGSELDPKAVARKLISLYYSNNKQYYTECNNGITCNDGEWHGFMDACADAYDNVSSTGTLAYIINESSEYLITQSIPLAGGEGSGPSPASNLVRKNNTIQVVGYTTPADALQDGCYLVVEPITWLYVRINNGPWDSPSTYESTRTYGTYWNLASKWVGTGGFYNTIMTKLFNNCLAISRTVTSPTGKTLQGIESTNQKSVADSLNYMNAGYGLSMHISKIHN